MNNNQQEGSPDHQAHHSASFAKILDKINDDAKRELRHPTARPIAEVEMRIPGLKNVSAADMAVFRNVPKSEPTGQHRINPMAGMTDVEKRLMEKKYVIATDDSPGVVRSIPVTQPHQNTWQKLVTKLKAIWRRLFN